jgi:fatty acid desaturase
MASALCEPSACLVKDSELKQQLQQLRQADNWTNWYYLARTYLLLAGTLGGTIWFYAWRETAGLHVLWNLLVTAAAVILVGALQHHLSNLGHEASHHALFRNRYLNDLVSDWLCMFPMFSTTHHYRLHHLAHHQFVNDPQRDPDVAQMHSSGYWHKFPLSRPEVWRTLAAQLWPPNLVRFMRGRARYNVVATSTNPYLKPGWKPSKMPVRVAAFYLAAQAGLLTALVWQGNPLWLALGPLAPWAAMLAFFGWLPEQYYYQTRIRPTISLRATTQMRLTWMTLLLAALAWITWLTGRPAAGYFLLLWIVPLFTSYAFFMLLRQFVQHGNGDRGMLTNTRVFFVGRLITFCVFPIGQRYHLPHHLYSTVPHYRLRKLHELLLKNPEYRQQAVIVEGYFLPPHTPATRPTVVDVLGPAYAPRPIGDVYIDNSVLEANQVDEKAEILRAGAAEIRRARELAGSPLTAGPEG